MDAHPTDLTSALSAWRPLIEQRLAQSVALSTDVPSRLAESMAYSLLAGGKRLRPMLVLLACEACGGEIERAVPAACALEMVHTYSLIHDDLPAMDDDDLRRGKPTNHVVYGEALAILAGDGLLTRAFEILATEVSPPDVAAMCCADLAAAAGWAGMVAGQVADLEAENAGIQSVNDLEGIHRRKTGRLISCGLLMGGRIAGASPSQLQTLEEYGWRVGLAFQITDDLLDLSSTPEKLGKGTQKDAGLGKLTYPGLIGVTESQRRIVELLESAKSLADQFGDRGQRLIQLADFVGKRDH
jgi:geranylgeranyl diphosphate synthase, type II